MASLILSYSKKIMNVGDKGALGAGGAGFGAGAKAAGGLASVGGAVAAALLIAGQLQLLLLY